MVYCGQTVRVLKLAGTGSRGSDKAVQAHGRMQRLYHIFIWPLCTVARFQRFPRGFEITKNEARCRRRGASSSNR